MSAPASDRQTNEPPAPNASPVIQSILDEAGRFEQARQLAETLQAADRALKAALDGNDLVGVAQARRLRARTLADRNKPAEAAAAWEAAAAAWLLAGDGPGQIEALAEAGLLWLSTDPAKAAGLVTQALSRGRTEAMRPMAAAHALYSAGRSAFGRRRLDQASKFFAAALARQEALLPDSLDLSASVNGLGVVAWQQGDLQAAETYLRRALAIREKVAPDSKDVGASLNNLANVLSQQSDWAAAGEYYRRALVVWGTQAPDSLELAVILNNIGNVAFWQGDLPSAVDHHRRALAIREKLAPESLALGESLNNLGLVAEKQADLAAAEAHHRRALALKERLVPESLAVAASLNNLGLVLRKQGSLPLAREHFQRALAILEKLAPTSLDLVRSLNNLGELAYQQGDVEEAERLGSRAWALVRDQAASVSGDDARQAFDASTALYAAHLLRYQLARGRTERAFLTLEEGRAQALQQLVFERRVTAALPDTKLWSAYREAGSAQSRAEQALSSASAAEALARRKLGVLQQERAAAPAVDLTGAEAALSAATERRTEAESAFTRARVEADERWSDIKHAAPRAFPPPLTLEQARAALPPDMVFVAFSIGDEESHGVCVSARGPVCAWTIAASADQLRAEVAAFRRHLTNPDASIAALAATSRVLFTTLFPGTVRQVVGSAKRLLVSPDGPLWDISFAALVTNARGRPAYLGAAAPITYTPSLALFAQSRRDEPRRTSGANVSAVVVGNPIFDRRTASGAAAMPPASVPATAREARAIAGLYGGVLLTGEEATEASLRTWIESADVIHLATHGYLHPTRPMSSGILLTVPKAASDRDRGARRSAADQAAGGSTRGNAALGAAETNDDGILQAWEVYSQLTLRSELVVLSGCETARGQPVRGEGIIGLTRALQYAGARSIIASQWKVDDESTRKLMVALHRNLRRGVAKDAALRRAMAALRANARTAHPYDWAPFLLIGDPENPDLGIRP